MVGIAFSGLFFVFFDLVRAGEGAVAKTVLSFTDWIAFFCFAAMLMFFFPWMFSTCRFQLNSRVNFFPHSSHDQFLQVLVGTGDPVMSVVTVDCNGGEEGGMESEEAKVGMEDERGLAISGKFCSITEGRFVCNAEAVVVAFMVDVDLVATDDIAASVFEVLWILDFCLLL